MSHIQHRRDELFHQHAIGGKLRPQVLSEVINQLAREEGRQNLDPLQILALFTQHDSNRDGEIDIGEYRGLLASAGL